MNLQAADAVINLEPSWNPALPEQRLALAQRREREAEAGGQLLAAVVSFLGDILPEGGSQAPAPQAVAALRAGLAECVETVEDGKLWLAATPPGMQSLAALAVALAKPMAVRESGSAGAA